MNLKTFQLVFACLSLSAATSGYRILGLFPLPAKSHFNCNNAIMQSLAAAGHEVVVVTPFPDQPPMENYRIIDFSQNLTFYVNQNSPKDFSEMSTYQITHLVTNNDKMYCEKFLQHEEIKKWFQSEEKLFDAIFFEMLGFYECYTPLAQKWNIPIIGTITIRSWNVPEKAIGNPRLPSVIPGEMGQPWRLNNLYGRFRNTISHLWTDLLMSYFLKQSSIEFYNAHTDALSPISEYRSIKPSLVFFNSHFSFFSRAMNPNAIEIGGIHVGKEKPLPENIQTFIDEAENGVIMFTLGSVVRASTLPKEATLAFKEAFRRIPQRVIWKYEDPMDDVPENVMLSPWLPQRDIMAHENVKAVISHCGLSGTYELISTGKPTIATPLFVDQLYNAILLEEKGAAINLDIYSVDKETILDSINRIINDTSYATNMQKLSRAFKDRPMTAQQTVVYWTEYVIRHNGAPHFRTRGSDLNLFQYYLIDILFSVLVVIGLLVYAIKWTIRKFKTYFCACDRYRRVNVNKKMS